MADVININTKEPYPVGVYEDMPFDEYNNIDAIRSHDLTSIIKDPYTWKYETKADNEASFFIEGRLQHCLFLEPHVFADEFVIAPNIDRRTKLGKEEYAEFMDSVGNRTVVNQAMVDECQARVEVLDALRPTDKDQTELTIVFDFYEHRCKARLDMLAGSTIIDLKTCRSASPRSFIQSVKSYGYYQQGAFYLTAGQSVGLDVDSFQFIALQKAQPYPYVVYELTPESIAYGSAQNQQAIDIMMHCKEHDIYTPYNLHNKIVPIELHDL
jgi:hypothetical protein